jgi:hypothetical protein
MKALLAIGFSALLLLFNSRANAAQGTALPTPTCAWQFEWTPFGRGNWLWADTANRWWYMPVDAQWQELRISGDYPKARFFSFAVYDHAPIATGLADHLYDAQIAPDQGSANPFLGLDQNVGKTRERPGRSYSITVTRGGGENANELNLNAATGWLLYRLYLPNAGEGSMGGVPLPRITIPHASGNTTQLPTCAISNRQSEISRLQPQIVPAALENPLENLVIPPAPDRVWFGTIANPPARLLPNPDNKYLASVFMPEYRPGSLVVIHGKMPGFPDTYKGHSVSQPASGFTAVEMRYWGACQAELVSPMPVTGCATDAATPLDDQGFYTIVVSNDVLRPHWLDPSVVWLPWGDEAMVPKLLFIRNLLPAPHFKHSVQAALGQGCGLDFTFPVPPAQDAIRRSGQCARAVMADYYPEAVWCDIQTFVKGGWKACFHAADVPVKQVP